MLDLSKHTDLIRKVVWSYARKSGLEFGDLLSEAYLACLEAQSKYHSGRGAETTFIWHVVSNRMKDLLAKSVRDGVVAPYENVGEVAYTGVTSSPEKEYLARERWEEKFAQLSPEAQYICQLTTKPVRYLSTDTPSKYQKALLTVLMNRGWKKAQVKRVFSEIKEIVRS